MKHRGLYVDGAHFKKIRRKHPFSEWSTCYEPPQFKKKKKHFPLPRSMTGGYRIIIWAWLIVIPRRQKKTLEVNCVGLASSHSCGHLLVLTGYKWDYTFYKRG